MNKYSEQIEEIVQKRKLRVEELGLKDDFQFLLNDSNFIYWSSWLVNHNEQWKNNLKSMCNIDNITEGVKDKNIKERILIEFKNGIEFKFQISEYIGFDDFIWSDITLFVNDVEVIEYKLNTNYSEYGAYREIGELKGFKEHDWINEFKEFIYNVKLFIEKERNIDTKRFESEDLSRLRIKFGITIDEIQSTNSNLIYNKNEKEDSEINEHKKPQNNLYNYIFFKLGRLVRNILRFMK